MEDLIRDLRLEIAQFNNFIIKNYFVVGSDIKKFDEPRRFMFDNFFKLISGLGTCSSALNKNDLPRYEDGLLLKDLITNAINCIYILEKSTDEQDLVLNIKCLTADSIRFTLHNIENFGKIYKVSQTEIDKEVEQLKELNKGFFDDDGKLIYKSLDLSTGDAISYLINNTHISQIKDKFISTHELYEHLSQNEFLDKFSAPVKSKTETDSNNSYLLKIYLNSIQITLLAISYIEPFFESTNQIGNVFVSSVDKIFSLYSKLYKLC